MLSLVTTSVVVVVVVVEASPPRASPPRAARIMQQSKRERSPLRKKEEEEAMLTVVRARPKINRIFGNKLPRKYKCQTTREKRRRVFDVEGPLLLLGTTCARPPLFSQGEYDCSAGRENIVNWQIVQLAHRVQKRATQFASGNCNECSVCVYREMTGFFARPYVRHHFYSPSGLKMELFSHNEKENHRRAWA